MSQDELKLEKCTNHLCMSKAGCSWYIYCWVKNEICRTICKYDPICLKNHILVYDVCVCVRESLKKVQKEGKRLWTVVAPSEWNQKEGVLIFYFIHMHVWIFQHIPIVILKKEENSTRLTPWASSKNRAKEQWPVMGVAWLGWEVLQ